MTEIPTNDTYKLLTLNGAKRFFVRSQRFFVCHPKTSNQNQTIAIITHNIFNSQNLIIMIMSSQLKHKKISRQQSQPLNKTTFESQPVQSDCSSAQDPSIFDPSANIAILHFRSLCKLSEK